MADATTLSFAFMRAHPADAARVLESAPGAAAAALLADAPVRIGSPVLAAMLPPSAANLLRELSTERARELLAALDAQQAAAILRQFDNHTRPEYLAGLPSSTALTAKLLLEFIDDAVGACMNPQVIALESQVGAEAALERLRHADTTTDRLYVIGSTRILLGIVSPASLLRAAPTANLESLLVPAPDRLAANAPIGGALAHPGWRTAAVLPVVDRRGRLLGEVTRDTLERAASRHRPSYGVDASLASVLAHSYWQGFTGILELLLSLLPASRPIGSRPLESRQTQP